MIYMKQSEAARRAEEILREATPSKIVPPVRLKKIRGICCIFLDRATSTHFYGDDWPQALSRLAVVFKKAEPEASATSAPKVEL